MGEEVRRLFPGRVANAAWIDHGEGGERVEGVG